jgi:hypothetical protein
VGTVKEGEPAAITENRGLETLRDMRNLLCKFWKAEDEPARAWYIHRARELYQRHAVLPKMSTALAREGRRPRRDQTRQPGTASLRIDQLTHSFDWVYSEAERLLTIRLHEKDSRLNSLSYRSEQGIASRAPGLV